MLKTTITKTFRVLAIAIVGVVCIAFSSSHNKAIAVGNYPDLGVQFHGMWSSYGTDDSQRIDVLNRLQAAGIHTVRIDVDWAMLQPNNGSTYDPWGLSFIDRVIQLANDRSICPLIMLWHTPGWANNHQGSTVLPTNVADYARVAEFAANRWTNKVAGWEVWNEPNSNAFLAGADPVAYTRLLQAAYPAFHRGYSPTTVVFGGVEYNDDGWIKRAYDAGAKGSFDAMATHPYMGMADASPLTADDNTMWTFQHVSAVRNLMVARGDGAKPIWFTEFGWSTHANGPNPNNWERGVSEDTQAWYLRHAAHLMRDSMPYVAKAYWYTERDSLAETNLQNQNYGLLRLDHSQKPAWYVMQGLKNGTL